jgi:hypothetical protein
VLVGEQPCRLAGGFLQFEGHVCMFVRLDGRHGGSPYFIRLFVTCSAPDDVDMICLVQFRDS